ncbi:MAG: hypothetical protein K5776_10505 [Lachnospiraceae bacterium]|nr:hypothetical protein [Lachnospiraceae bacterium]
MKNNKKLIILISLLALAVALTLVIIFGVRIFLKNSEKSQNPTLSGEIYNFDLNENGLFEGNYSDEEMGDYQLCFSGDVNNFSSVSIGKDSNSGSKITIDNEYICVYSNNNLKAQSECLVDISGNISITVNNDLRNNADIVISSNGKSQTVEDVYWSARIGKIFAEAGDDTSLSNCTLSYVCNGWGKPVWLLGDSYFNCTSSARWTSYMTENGYDNYLLNGYPGRNSDAALESLKVMLGYGKPEEIIWCLGMNDGDSDEAINESYKRDVEEVIKLCKENNIELVLSTVPSCPMVNNDYKNKYVKESGYRYIDFASVVGANENISWYPGMLEDGEERIHPTKEGAAALYNEAVKDCPELLKK